MRVNNQDAVVAIANHHDFINNNGTLMGAGVLVSWDSGTGEMPEDVAQRFRDDFPQVTYVIRSYATPIAWYVPGKGWMIPAAKYSVATSRHQGIVRRGIELGKGTV